VRIGKIVGGLTHRDAGEQFQLRNLEVKAAH
jgi:hypothetical protein